MTKIFIAGDSTASIKASTAYPETGWGEAFRFMLPKEVELRNYAVNGRSTKSFIDDGLFEKIANEIEEGDFLLIQFGHNDGKEDDPARYTDPEVEYPQNLKKYIEMAKQNGATPVLLTSVPRRYFDNGVFQRDNIGPYPDVMRSVAKEENVLLADINKVIEALLIKLGDESSKAMYLIMDKGRHNNYIDGIVDNTHLSPYGAFTIATYIAEELKRFTEFSEIIL